MNKEKEQRRGTKIKRNKEEEIRKPVGRPKTILQPQPSGVDRRSATYSSPERKLLQRHLGDVDGRYQFLSGCHGRVSRALS